jgi:hypothetical protein
VLENGLPPTNFCQMSGVLWSSLSMCVCTQCATACAMPCSGGGDQSAQCMACVFMDCQQQYNACKSDRP